MLDADQKGNFRDMKKTFALFGTCVGLGILVASGPLLTGCSGDRYNQSTGEKIDDAAVTSKVKGELLADPDVKGLAIKVKTYKGEVQLSGFVDSQAQKNRAGEIARAVKGVQWVKNDVIVK
jgi:hypothetical protein